MIDVESSEPYVHKLDGLPEEREAKRVLTRNLGVCNPVVGRVVDLTENGLGIECDQPLRVRDQYPFTLVCRSGRFHKTGEVRWSRLTSTGLDDTGRPKTVYRVGVAFV